jgi:CTP synthase
MEKKSNIKYVLVIGAVLSGIGKGVIASSSGVLLQGLGCHVTNIKIDPYLNVDSGTMSPFEHGECFVLDDGGETDLDLGNYERFLDIDLKRDNNITTGKIYSTVIAKERKGEYLGKTVQIIPHITNCIQDWIQRVAEENLASNDDLPRVCVVELGGTIGDIEGMPFIEAMRQFQFRVGPENFSVILISLVPETGSDKEQKTKPTQHAVKELRSLGLTPDIIACRSGEQLTTTTKEKLSQFCHVREFQVISVYNVSNLYKVPLLLKTQGLMNFFQTKFNISSNLKPQRDFSKWESFADQVDLIKSSKEEPVRIAIVGKYTGLSDSYHSVTKSFEHASVFLKTKIDFEYINSDHLTKDLEGTEDYEFAWKIVKRAQGILIPGGFSNRGVAGKILATEYARKNKIPFLGICLGMQVAIIEFARNVLGLEDANSTEFDANTTNPVVINMPEISLEHLGGTMRLGKRTSYFKGDCKIKQLYGSDTVDERHRHRYEANLDYVEKLESRGFKFVAQDETKIRQEIIELDDHPYFVGVQYHPELKSRPFRPSPPFLGLVLAASGKLDSYLKK